MKVKRMSNVATILTGVVVLGGLGGALILTGTANGEAVPMVVYKNPSCGCCTKWAEQLEQQGFDTEVRPVRNLGQIKQQVGVPSNLGSCHTAEVGGYFIEGHVPAADIQRLLEEKPDIAGLTVPGMPVGSPGMEVPGRKAQSYKVYAIDRQGNAQVFASH